MYIYACIYIHTQTKYACMYINRYSSSQKHASAAYFMCVRGNVDVYKYEYMYIFI